MMEYRVLLRRNESGLCGLENEGSTCYLNSLIQTLLFTPEFRDALFSLPEKDLGSIDEQEGKLQRVIPLQLQKLFARLLIVDRQTISTVELTRSFGWSGQEELQQHDVQELNRILFSAIEKSLVGTSGHNLISQLYRGTVSSQVTCSQCNTSSQRMESFLDLTVIVSGHENLEESLKMSFLEKEVLLGKNKYFCSRCSEFVEAEKRDKLLSLPPILSLSLLRFTYDSDQGKRFKETGEFYFPMEIDMQPYCDKDVGDDSKYQLFSVIVHSGTCYGGHYHAYIRDIDHLGLWKLNDEKQNDFGDGKYQCTTNPISLIASILMQQPQRGLHMQSLFSEICNAGLSWNRRFKKTFGPLKKFLLKNSNIFSYNKATDYFYMRNGFSLFDEEQQSKANVGNCELVNFSSGDSHWFDFNDSHVSAVHMSQMKKQFGGKESSYMLFYRRMSLIRPKAARSNPTYCISDRMLKLVVDENSALEVERKQYEESLHIITLTIHFGKNYQVLNGALHPIAERLCFIIATFDNRKTLSNLHDHIYELSPDLCNGENRKLHRAVALPAGMHLFNEFSENDKSLLENGISNGVDIFVWDGVQVGGTVILTGDDWAPVLLSISCSTLSGDSFVVKHGFPKCSTVREVKHILTEITILNEPLVILLPSSSVHVTFADETYLPLENRENDSLESLKLQDNDCLLVREILPMLDREKQVFVYNHTGPFASIEEQQCPVECFTVDKDVALFVIKKVAYEKFCVEESIYNYRFRKPLGDQSWKEPLYEHLSVEDVLPDRISHLILEEGNPPKEDEITLMLSVGKFSGIRPDYSLNVKKSSTLLQCLRTIVKHCGLEGDCWHLSKINWMAHAEDVLGKDDATLDRVGLVHGDLLLLQAGRLAPPGFLSLPIWFVPSLGNLGSRRTDSDVQSSELVSMYCKLWTNLKAELGETSSAIYIGEVEISSLLTLVDLKRLVLTLPKLSDVFFPNVRHVRLRFWDGRLPGHVLRNHGADLKKLKISNHQPLCVQLLAVEEDLSEDDVVLQVQRRIPKTSQYEEPGEVVWNSGSSSHAASLRLVLSEATGISDEHLVMAKHYSSEYSWKVIAPSVQAKGTFMRKAKLNLRKPPFCLKDGDVIAVQNKLFDPELKDDFRTDEERQLWLCMETERTLPKGLSESESSDARQASKSEVGITIHVHDFAAT